MGLNGLTCFVNTTLFCQRRTLGCLIASGKRRRQGFHRGLSIIHGSGGDRNLSLNSVHLVHVSKLKTILPVTVVLQHVLVVAMEIRGARITTTRGFTDVNHINPTYSYFGCKLYENSRSTELSRALSQLAHMVNHATVMPGIVGGQWHVLKRDNMSSVYRSINSPSRLSYGV